MAIDPRPRSESEYPNVVRLAGPRGMRLYDRTIETLIGTGMSEETATGLALIHFPSLLAHLAPEPEPETPNESERHDEQS